MADNGGNTGDNSNTVGNDDPKFVKGDNGVETITLTQDQLNKMMADNRRKLTSQNTQMAEQLEQLQGQVKMTDEERTKLAETVESLRTQTLSEKELAKRELAKKDAKHQETVTGLEKELDDWRNRYTGAEIKRALVDGANHEDVKAYDAEQMVDLLEGKTQLVFEEDGSQKVVVTMAGENDKGEPIELALSPVDAMKAMKEQKRFANLFVAKGAPGLGEVGNVGKGGGPPDMNDMAAYMVWRKNTPELAG